MRTLSAYVLRPLVSLFFCLAFGCSGTLAEGQAIFGSIPEVHIIERNGMIALQPTVDFLIDAKWSVDKEAGKITVTLPKDGTVTYTLGSTTAQINGLDETIAVAPFEHLGVFYVPSEPLAKAGGGSVTVEAARSLINMTFDGPDGKYSIYLPYDPADIYKKFTRETYVDSDTELYVVSVNGNGQRRVSYNTHPDSLPVFAPTPAGDRLRIISERHGKLYIRNVNDRYESLLADASYPPGVPEPFLPDPPVIEENVNALPELPLGGKLYPETASLDGSAVVFSQRFQGPNGESQTNLGIVALSGTDTLKLLGWKAEYPSFMPDGKRIAFTNREFGPSMVAIIDPNNPRQPRRDREGERPVFSPSGKALLFTRTYLNENIPNRSFKMLSVFLTADGGQGARFLEPSPEERTGDENAGGFSPDSTSIVFSTETGIYVMKTDRTGRRQLTTDRQDRAPQFTQDGKQIVFIRGTDLYIMQADGSNARALTKDVKVLEYRLMPSGQQIFFIARPEEPK